jgi:hypothetical protein
MRRRERNGPNEDDWLAEEEWLEAPTEEMSSPSPRRPAPRPPGTPSRRLVVLVAGISVLLLAVLVIVFQGDGDEPEESAATTQTETAPASGSDAEPSLQLQEGDPLSEGDTGPRVRRLQRALARLGFDVTPDGVFGPGTTAAVRSFQEEAGLDADGVVGSGTVRAVNDALAEGG